MRKYFLWYHFFRLILVGTGLRFFYKSIKIEGKNKIPANKPILIVPNHQNSFMDALLITSNLQRSLYFLTRAKAFKSKFMNWYLRSLQMLPVYRVRDGMKNIQKNEAIFQTCVDKLSNKEAVLIFAEANHDLKRRLRPLSKGFTRIAFDAEIQNNWELDLYIMPVGVNYSDHRNSRNEVRVVYGDPIKVSDFKEIYDADPRTAANDLKNATSDQLKETIMHVPKLNQYPLVKVALDEMEPDRDKLANPVYMNALVEKLNDKQTEDLISSAEQVLEVAEKNDLEVRLLANVKRPKLKLILLFPIYLFAWLNSIIPYQPARRIIENKVEDPAFEASIKFVLGLFLFPIFYFLVFGILLILGVPFVWALTYLVFSLFSSMMFKRVNEVFRNFSEKKKIRAFKEKNPDQYAQLIHSLELIKTFRLELLTSE